MADVNPSLGVQVEVTTGSADVVRRVVWPQNATRFTVEFRTNAGKMAHGSAIADGAALSSTPYDPLAANTKYEFPVPGCERGKRKRNLIAASRHTEFTSATGSTVFTVTAYP